MGTLQKLRFRTIDDFLEYLPRQERVVVDRLRQLVLGCLPECTEKLSYNVPFYTRHRRVCFIWPASVPWGKVEAKGVLLGFCHGSLLQDEINYLHKDDRKQVYTKTFFSLQDLEEDMVKAYLFDAAQVDEQLHAQKNLRTGACKSQQVLPVK